MKQINFPFVSSVTNNRSLIQVIIESFTMHPYENSDFVDVRIQVKDYTGTILEFNTSVDRSIAEYYKDCYETKRPINILSEKRNYLIFTPDIDIV